MNQSGNCRPCVVCGEVKTGSFKVYFDGYVKLYRCLACGFIAQYPGPGMDTVVTDYDDRYSLDFVDKGMEFMYPKSRSRLQDIARRIARLKPGARVLDVGCGDGQFLHICAGLGLHCSGVEPSRNLAAYAASKTGADVANGFYSRELFAGNSFDVISLIQVLEHVPNPVDVLNHAAYHLKPGGMLVIEVPSVCAPHFLAYRVTGMKSFVKPPTGVILSHCNYFSPQTLTKLIDQNGFRTFSLVTGRWQHKYGWCGRILDPFLDRLKLGGILLIAENART